MKKHNGRDVIEAADAAPAYFVGNDEINAACNAALARRGVPTFDFQPRFKKRNGALVATVKRRALARFQE